MTGAEAAGLLGVEFPPVNTPEYRAKLKSAWRRAAKEHHPDVHATAGDDVRVEASARFARSEEANRVLLGILDGRLGTDGEPVEDKAADADDDDDDLWELLEEMKDMMVAQGAVIATQSAAIQRLRAESAGLKQQVEQLKTDVDDLMVHAERIGRLVTRMEAAPAPPGIQPRRVVPAPVPVPGRRPVPPVPDDGFRGLDQILDAASDLRGRINEARSRARRPKR